MECPTTSTDQQREMQASSDLWKGTKKVFQDSVHGSVGLHGLLVKIIDTPEFQRLRNIRQVGMSYNVFPAASHTRFEHSIGVCYLASRMLQALELNSDPAIMAAVTRQEKLCVLIAALCHDIGHGPFSHSWETFVRLATGTNFQHEKASVDLLKHMLNARDGALMKEFEELGLRQREIHLIGEIIYGKGTLLEPNKYFLYSIVSNDDSGVDVDKWDYFLRDGMSLGMKVTFDYQRLLQFTRVERQADGNYHIVFRDKEKMSLQDMFRMRADLHLRAYQHPVAKKLEAMLLDALLSADPHFKIPIKKDRVRMSEAHKNMKHYSRLGDYVTSLIRCSEGEELREARRILQRIELRDFYEDVGAWEIKVGETPPPIGLDFLRNLRKNLKKAHSVTVIPSVIDVNNGKYRDPVSRVKFYEKDRPSKPARFYPDIRYELPFIVLKAFCREKISEEVKKVIQADISEALQESKIEVKDVKF